MDIAMKLYLITLSLKVSELKIFVVQTVKYNCWCFHVYFINSEINDFEYEIKDGPLSYFMSNCLKLIWSLNKMRNFLHCYKTTPLLFQRIKQGTFHKTFTMYVLNFEFHWLLQSHSYIVVHNFQFPLTLFLVINI